MWPVHVRPRQTRVAFMVRVRFLAVTALGERGMTFHLWLREPVVAPSMSMQEVDGIDIPGR